MERHSGVAQFESTGECSFLLALRLTAGLGVDTAALGAALLFCQLWLVSPMSELLALPSISRWTFSFLPASSEMALGQQGGSLDKGTCYQA